ncbi:MAG: TraR/DksA family transcriptional regulator [Gammaproteobacteria bacterium]|nr:TraR/DksA family transcriptional regulator [Gammaproteobacteria bacterium]
MTPSISELAPDQLQILQQQLEQHKQELEGQLEQGSAAAKPVTLDQQAVGRVSRVDAIQQQQMAIASQQQATLLLQRIEIAQQRIESGEYGLCLKCAEPIAFARLQAQPTATLCIECQSTSENP